MKIEMWALSKVTPYPGNPRINDASVDAVAASIREFGFRQPIVVDSEGVIICGHTRYKAAQKLGLAKVPVHVAKDLSPEQIKAYRIADNKVAEGSAWDYDLLPIELGELQNMNYDLGLLGFDPDELARLLEAGGNEGLTDPDDIPEPPDEPVTQPGDLWVLGKHRLLCGDSSKAEDVDRLLDGQPIHLVNTDPPYNVKVEPRSNNAIAAGNSSFQKTHHQKFDLERHPEKAQPTTKKMRAKDRPLANDFISDEAFEEMLQAWFGNMTRVLLPGRGFYIWGGYANIANYPAVLKAHELVYEPNDYLGQAASSPDPQGLYGRARMVFLRVETRRRAPVLRPQQCHRPMGHQESQSAIHDPLDGKTRRTGDAGDGVFFPARRKRFGFVWRIGLDLDRRGNDRAEGVPHGTGSALLRRDRAAL